MADTAAADMEAGTALAADAVTAVAGATTVGAGIIIVEAVRAEADTTVVAVTTAVDITAAD
jgi:hypothetical protein